MWLECDGTEKGNGLRVSLERGLGASIRWRDGVRYTNGDVDAVNVAIAAYEPFSEEKKDALIELEDLAGRYAVRRLIRGGGNAQAVFDAAHGVFVAGRDKINAGDDIDDVLRAAKQQLRNL